MKGKLETFVIPGSGVEVQVRKISPLLAMQLSKSFTPPQPPMAEVDYGDGHKIMEPNPAHPAYVSALQEYQVEYETRLRQMMIDQGVVVKLSDEDRTEVTDLKTYWKVNFNIDLPGSDEAIFVSFIAITDQNDYMALINRVMGISQANSEDTAAARTMFQGQVPR